jgi:hypothetical protein
MAMINRHISAIFIRHNYDNFTYHYHTIVLTLNLASTSAKTKTSFELPWLDMLGGGGWMVGG